MRVAWAGAVIAAATIVTGHVLRASGTTLGVPTPPFLGPYFVQVDPLALLAAAVLGAGVWLAPRALALRPAAFGVATLIATVVVRLAVNAARTGTSGWDRMFDPFGYFEGKNEYLPALRALQYGPRFLLDRFAELVPSLPPHAAAHPPGTLLVLTRWGSPPRPAMAALCIAAGALATPLAYLTARAVADEQGRGRDVAAGLCPGRDPVRRDLGGRDYLALGMLAAWPLAMFARRGGAPHWRTGAAAMAVATLFAWSLPAVAAWAAVLALRRGGVRRAAVSVACAGRASSVSTRSLRRHGLRRGRRVRATEDIYRFSVASMRPYAYWVFGSPVAFLVVSGSRSLARGFRALAARDRPRRRSSRSSASPRYSGSRRPRPSASGCSSRRSPASRRPRRSRPLGSGPCSRCWPFRRC